MYVYITVLIYGWLSFGLFRVSLVQISFAQNAVLVRSPSYHTWEMPFDEDAPPPVQTVLYSSQYS